MRDSEQRPGASMTGEENGDGPSNTCVDTRAILELGTAQRMDQKPCAIR